MKAELVDYMGDDLRVVNAARVSFDKESEWEFPGEKWGPDHFVKRLSEKDQKLINYLARHNHWTPFSHVQITMRETVPIFVARQRFKHMVGFTYNEVSRRYVDDRPEFFVPDAFRAAPENAKQGSGGDLPYSQTEYISGLKEHHKMCANYYQWLLDEGVAPEK